MFVFVTVKAAAGRTTEALQSLKEKHTAAMVTQSETLSPPADHNAPGVSHGLLLCRSVNTARFIFVQIEIVWIIQTSLKDIKKNV